MIEYNNKHFKSRKELGNHFTNKELAKYYNLTEEAIKFRNHKLKILGYNISDYTNYKFIKEIKVIDTINKTTFISNIKDLSLKFGIKESSMRKQIKRNSLYKNNIDLKLYMNNGNNI